MQDHADELARLAQVRARADRLYNEALTALDRAKARRADLPPLTDGYDDRQIQPLNESWRVLPDETIDLGTGWRRRLRGVAWRLIGPILQRQQRFNALLVEHLNRNVEAARQSHAAAAALVVALDRHLQALGSFQGQLMHYLQQITLYVDTRDGHVAGQALLEIAKLRSLADGLGNALNAVTDEFRKRMESAEIRDARAAETSDELENRTRALNAALNAVTEEFRRRLESAQVREYRTARTIEDLGGRTRALRQSDERIAADLKEVRDSAHTLQDSVDEHAAEQERLRQSVELATAATHALKREVEQRRDSPRASAAGRADVRATRPGVTDLEAYKYLCFEDAFRGPREEIAARQREYLAYFEGASDVLDLGCGRGEFLALLREQGITARGIDANAELVERCREQDLDTIRGDALDYLGGLADESLGGLFSAQVVEHLEAEYLTRVLAETRRVLRPGSRIVLETINPASWAAFFSAFVRDITHRHPLHPDTLGYFLRASGFVDVSIVYQSPVPEAAQLQRAAVDATLAETPAGAAVRALAETFNRHVDRLNGLFFAEQDYAAIARRP